MSDEPDFYEDDEPIEDIMRLVELPADGVTRSVTFTSGNTYVTVYP